ncbi:hypothetical protein Tco_0716836 [Tanacetum coccineum]
MVGITFEEEENASESFSGIRMPKNGSLFMFVEEDQPVDPAGYGATTSAIGVMTSGAWRSTLDGGLSNHQTMVETKYLNQFLKVVQTMLKEEG